MFKKRLLACLLASLMVISSFTPMTADANNVVSKDSESPLKAVATTEIEIEKSTAGNPLVGFNATGDRTYSGDPAALVDGDTVYLYTGHDTSTNESYVIPEWQCYSSKDMVNWTYEGVTMKASSIPWARDTTAAWAGQVTKHYNSVAAKYQYYFYHCTWDKTDSGKQSIGVAVSDSPTGPFVDKGSPIVKGSTTTNESSSWNDIDPTVWIDEDENGVEHRYLAWGNSKYYVCELNEDMISVKDVNGDGSITFGTDIVEKNVTALTFTEAPWLYRRQDENGDYYGQYYMFYAQGWREQMAYATTDDLMSGTWTYGGNLMPPTATSNTNHSSVIDFNGKTYFIYHNGSLAGGSGFRRVICAEEFTFNADGSIDPIAETAVGISGNYTQIVSSGNLVLSHAKFTNSGSDSVYPYSNVTVSCDNNALLEDTQWEIVPGKADKTKTSYVSIEANNKPGLYLTVSGSNVVLAQDATGTTAVANNQTFKTVLGLSGTGISFESVAQPGYFITAVGSAISLTDGTNAGNCTFSLGFDENDTSLRSITATKTNTDYATGATLSLDDLKVTASYGNATTKEITTYTTNAASLDMSVAGTKTLTVTYTEGDITRTYNITIIVKSPVINKQVAAEYNMTYDGTVLKDISGNGNDAKLNGTYTFSDNALVLNGSGYVDLPMGITNSLSDLENFTIESKFTKASDIGVCWLYSFGSIASSTGANYLFYTPDFSHTSNTMRAGIKNSASETLLTLNNVLTANQYYTVTMVVSTGGVVSVYLDGTLIDSKSSGYNMTEIIANGTANNVLGWIGKSCWSGDANYKGNISSFKVYNKAMTAQEVNDALSTATDISSLTITPIADQTYTSSAITPSVIITDGTTTLQAGTDYQVTYSNNTNVGAATAIITGIGSYTGTAEVKFNIIEAVVTPTPTAVPTAAPTAAPTTSPTVAPSTLPTAAPTTAPTVTPPAKVVSVKATSSTTSSITLTWNKVNGANGYLVQSYDAAKNEWIPVADITSADTVKYIYKKRKKGTIYSLRVVAYVISGSEKVLGTLSDKVIYATEPGTPSITAKKTSSSKATITWKKGTNASGYQIQMKIGSGAYKKVATIKSATTYKYTKTKLKSNKKYTFRVRCYKKVGNKTIYGAYSAGKRAK